MSAQLPGPQNVFIRDHEASNRLTVNYARNIADFPVNKYTQVHKVEKIAGYYLRFGVKEAGRLIESDLSNFVWYDGQPRPQSNEGTEEFEWFPFECVRYSPDFTLGYLTIEQASWDILEQHLNIKARQCMTGRTQQAITALTTSGNYDATHVLNVATGITGNSGRWDQSTTARQDIRRSLNYAVRLIMQDSLNAVGAKDLQLVIGPGLASALSETQEIVDYIKSSPQALAMVRGDIEGGHIEFGLPGTLYGIPLVVEDTYKVTSRKGGTEARSAILANSYGLLVARPGALVSNTGGPNFSTCMGFFQEEMTVETLDDVPNRRKTGAVTDTYVYEITAPATGVCFTNCAS